MVLLFQNMTSKSMSKYNKLWRKPVILTSLNSIAFSGSKINTLSYASMKKQGCLSIVSHQQDNAISLLIVKTTKNTCKDQKFSRKKARRKCRSYLNHRHFSANYIYDPLEVFSKRLGTINIAKISKGTIVTKKIRTIFNLCF